MCCCPKKNRNIIAVLLFVSSLLVACDQTTRHQATQFGGNTMGTTWSIKITDLPGRIDRSSLEAELNAELEAINDSMSTYRPDSEISRLNKNDTGEASPVSAGLYNVLKEALRISAMTNGAFDVTVGPLVNLWGFGPTGHIEHAPQESEILEALSHTGADKILLDTASHAVRKSDPDIYIDLSAIAKGYAVDRLADILEDKGILNYMVEIGGELRLRGINDRGSEWVIAVEKPDPGSRSALTLIQPGQAAVATSGDYRNYFEENGVRYSHTIDPATGKPIMHSLASVSVINERCMTADALATALMVMGSDNGMAFAKEQKLSALFIVKSENGFESHATEQYKPYLR